MTSRSVELRSDTFTRPTEAMRRAMYRAEVGDDVWDEDPTVKRLQELAARLMGKEAGLFVSSGTQGNLIGLLSHTQPGNEVILGERAHIFNYEAAGTAVVGGLQLRTVPNTPRGRLDPDDVRAAIRPRDEHFPPTGCVAIENTHNSCGGAALSAEEIASVAAVAHNADVPVHLDGARLFNAAVALSTSAAALASSVDSVTFCLSKALGAPVGSVLCGSTAYIARARRWRKLLGGGMRQVGVLAAAGMVALDDANIARLAEDHANARLLAEGLNQIRGITCDPALVETNIVYFGIDGLGVSPTRFLDALCERGVRMAWGGTGVRAVTSYEASRTDVEEALDIVADVAQRCISVLA